MKRTVKIEMEQLDRGYLLKVDKFRSAKQDFEEVVGTISQEIANSIKPKSKAFVQITISDFPIDIESSDSNIDIQKAWEGK